MSAVQRTVLPSLTDRQPLGSSGLSVSPLCLGITEDPATVAAAFEAGINFFFITVDMHWPIYRNLRRGLQQLLASKPAARDEIVVAGVAYVTQPDFVWVPFQELLWELPELKRLDVTVAGGCYGYEIARRLPEYEKHRKKQHVGTRAIGASFHDRVAARETIEKGTLDIAFVRYNPPHPKARIDLFDKIPDRASGRKTLLYNFKSTEGFLEEADYKEFNVGADFWRPHITDYYRFALMEAALDGMLCSLPNPAAVREAADALARGPLDDDDREFLLDLGDLALGRGRMPT